jgi:hypothetical protein
MLWLKSEPILLAGLAGRRAKTKPPFRPPRPKAKAKRTISSLAANSFGNKITCFYKDVLFFVLLNHSTFHSKISLKIVFSF